jgi:hypothetical protein
MSDAISPQSGAIVMAMSNATYEEARHKERSSWFGFLVDWACDLAIALVEGIWGA